MLTILTFLPLIGVVAILLLRWVKRETDELAKQIAVVTSAVTFIMSLVVLASYDKSVSGLQMVEKAD